MTRLKEKTKTASVAVVRMALSGFRTGTLCRFLLHRKDDQRKDEKGSKAWWNQIY